MYYLLNFAPCILYIIDSIVPIKIDFGVFAIAYLFAQPLYLLLVNILYIYRGAIGYFHSIVYMILVILFNVLYTIIVHKIKFGYFIGDVPGGIYFLMICVPIVIIVMGIGIIYILKK